MKLPFPSFAAKEGAILRGVSEGYSIVHQVVLDFRGLLGSVAAHDPTSASSYFHKVLEGEKKADDFFRRLSIEIAEGAFFGGVREDMLTLIEKVDNVADSAKGASRLLEAGETFDEYAFALLASREMTSFADCIVGTVEALGELLKAFGKGRKEMLAKIPAVEQKEEEADALKDELARLLFSGGGRPDPITVIQLRDFLLVSDDIADNAEDASDVVLVLVAKGYG
jgi:predicted phosphate transport protein (TIGR00153 family)